MSESATPAGASSDPQPRARIAGPRDWFLCAFFALVWLVPLTYKGVTHRTLVSEAPDHLRYLHNASCLFTKSVKRFSAYYVEGRAFGANTWRELEHSEYSPLRPSGYRSRMEWMLGYSRSYGTRRTREAQRTEVAQWYMRRHAELNPSARPLEAIQLVRVAYPVGEGTPGAPGHWEPLPLDEIPEDSREVYFVYEPDKSVYEPDESPGK